MKINFSFSKLLDDNRVVKVISVFAAIIAWFIVASTVDDNGSKRTIDNIPVKFELKNTIPGIYGLSVIEGDNQTVNIKVEGKSTKIGNLTADDFIAVPEISNITEAGTYEVTVKVEKIYQNDLNYKIISNNPKVKVTFDHLNVVTKDLIPVANNITAAEGYVKETMLVTPNQITLKGPQTELDKIAKCVVENKENIVTKDTQIVKGTLVFYDIDNNKIKPKYTTYDKNDYEITVSIYKHKSIPIKVTFINQPKMLDTSLLEYTLSTNTLEISGPENIIDSYKEITLDPIDFRTIDTDSVFTRDVNLIAGVVNVNNIESVVVTIDGTNLDKKVLNIRNFAKQNEPADYTVTIKTSIINNVTMVGNTNDIDKLSSNDLIAVVDLSTIKISEGTTRVPVSIYSIGGNKFVWALGEKYSVLVSAKKK